jgi:hypothetical protein
MCEIAEMTKKPTTTTTEVRFQALSVVRAALEAIKARTYHLEGVKLPRDDELDRPAERFQLGHQVEALMAWFSVQPAEAQDRITLAGREIVRRLEAMEEPPWTLGPETFPDVTEPHVARSARPRDQDDPPATMLPKSNRVKGSVRGGSGEHGHKAAQLGTRAEVVEALRRRRDGKGD